MNREVCVGERYSIAGPADFVVIAHAAIVSDATIKRYGTAVV